MKYLSCVHTHTQFCDGKNTMEEFAREAFARGYRSLGFTPHSPLPYENDWAMKEEDLAAYKAEAARLKNEYEGKMEILCGIEWDLESGALPQGLDYAIGSVHSFSKNGVHFSVDYEQALLRKVTDELYGGDFVALCADYYALVVKSALRRGVDIVGHFDLPTKYNKDGSFVNEEDSRYLALAFDAVEEILRARPGMFFEINTGVMARAGKKMPYPHEKIMKRMLSLGARFVLTGDCHALSHLDGGYEESLRLLAKCGGKEVYLLTAKGFERQSLS
ncbi:MAG: histidinol-phosphatase [Clostridia bacterium]|nr:histidinol-phosphatase [Clostridia bacterium]